MREFGASDDRIALTKVITSDDFFPIIEVLEKVKRALQLAKGYDEEWFDYGKEAFLADLSEMIEVLTNHAKSALEVQFLRG